MNVTSVLSVAGSGIDAINRQLAVVSQNIANASTPGYAEEVSTQHDVTAGGVGMGVQLGPTTRNTDAALSAGLLVQNARAASLGTTSAALGAIDQVQGTPGAGNDLPSLLGKLTDAFTTLADDPSNQTQQQAVVSAARTLAGGVNASNQAYQTQRQSAQDAVVSDVSQANADVASLGSLSDQIVKLRAAGQSTADLENQRDGVLQDLSNIVGVRALPQSNGDMLLLTAGGLTVPLHGAAPFATGAATLGAAATYPGTIPAVTLSGVDVTRQLATDPDGGRIAANLTLRDTTLPTFQAELDEFSAQLSDRFDAQGLTLFSRADGSLPTAGAPVQSAYVGYAGEITVNPAVAATPATVRDGSHAVAGPPATAASAFTPNPAGGPSGFGTLIARVLDYALGANVRAGVAQPAIPTTGLGASGTLSAPYAAPADMQSLAASLTASQSTAASVASASNDTETALQTSLRTKLSAETDVSTDTELTTMTALQNAYGANAKVIAAAQAIWTDLINAVQP